VSSDLIWVPHRSIGASFVNDRVPQSPGSIELSLEKRVVGEEQHKLRPLKVWEGFDGHSLVGQAAIAFWNPVLVGWKLDILSAKSGFGYAESDH